MTNKHILIMFLCVVMAFAVGCAARNGNDSGEAAEETLKVTLYFADEQAMYVVPEVRDMTVPKGAPREDIITSVIKLLIDGPEEQSRHRTIPEGTQVKSVSIEGDAVTVDFSQEMTRAQGATGEAMALNSLVNTLTEFDYIKKVFFTVDGQVVPLEHFIPDEPLERNEDIIKR